jgi:putative lipoic acid-binding regulatory protein
MTAPEPPVTKYELTVKIRGNTHDEIEDELLTLVRGGYLLDSDYGKRDAWNSTGGRCTSVMVHTNPEQTPEKYRDELDAWWNEHKAARRKMEARNG